MAQQVSVINSEGLLLLNSEGNFMKQNYQRGFGFKNSGVRLYPPAINFQNPFTLLLGCLFDGTINGGRSTYFDVALTDGNRTSFTNNNGFGLGQTVNSSNYTFGTGVQSILDGYLKCDGSSFTVPSFGAKSSSLLGTANISYIDIGKGYNDAGFWRNTYPIFYIALFNRILSDGEYNYLVNAQSYNNPITFEGSLSFVSTGAKAEELDFSAAQDGSDLRVGLRDISGNNCHAEFNDLPSGTNASKLAYINTSSFFTTIQ